MAFQISRLYDFQPGTRALSGQVDSEFNQLVTAYNTLNDEVIALIALLDSATGAVPDLNGSTVQAFIESIRNKLKEAIEQHYAPRLTSVEEQINTLDAQKADDDYVKDLEIRKANKADYELLEARMDSVIQSADLDPNKDQEVVDARGAEATLNTRITKIEKVADFKLQNIITNGDFSNGTTDYLSNIGTMTALNGEAEVNVEYIGDLGAYIGQSKQIYKDRVYYARFDIKPKYSTATRFQIGGTNSLYVYPTPNEYNKISATVKAAADTYLPNGLRFIHYTKTDYMVGDKIYVKNFALVDLTSIFGVGNEPNVNSFERLLSIFPNLWFDGTEFIGTRFSKQLFDLYAAITQENENWEVEA